MIRIFRHKQPTISHDEARRLIARFFDGETTLSEEQDIYQYFAKGEVHPSLQQYGEMFGWYANNLQPAATKRRSWRWTNIAAAALIAGVIGTVAVKYITHPVDSQNELAEMYAGSYIIRNGKKITDINKVLHEAIKQEKYADQLLARCNKASDEMANVEMISVEDAINSIPDPGIRRQLAE